MELSALDHITQAKARLAATLDPKCACCDEPEFRSGCWFGIDFGDEPVCISCGSKWEDTDAPNIIASLPSPVCPATTAVLAGLISDLRLKLGIAGAPEDDDVALESATRQGTGAGQSFEKMDAINTVIIDRFLWSRCDDNVLESRGRLKCAYCSRCKALYPQSKQITAACQKSCKRNECMVECGGEIRERTRITNSLPLEQGFAIFCKMIHSAGWSLEGKTLVDIGSRMGNNLMLAALLTPLKEAIGIEISPFFAELSRHACAQAQAAQADIVSNQHQTVLTVVQSNIKQELSRLSDADVVVFFNPFEQHCSAQEHRTLLNLMTQNICKAGALLLTCPSMESIFARAGLDTAQLSAWLVPTHSFEDIRSYVVQDETKL